MTNRTTETVMSGKRARRMRIKANHDRLTKLHEAYWSEELRRTPVGKTPLSYVEWLHSNARRRAEKCPQLAGLKGLYS